MIKAELATLPSYCVPTHSLMAASYLLLDLNLNWLCSRYHLHKYLKFVKISDSWHHITFRGVSKQRLLYCLVFNLDIRCLSINNIQFSHRFTPLCCIELMIVTDKQAKTQASGQLAHRSKEAVDVPQHFLCLWAYGTLRLPTKRCNNHRRQFLGKAQNVREVFGAVTI